MNNDKFIYVFSEKAKSELLGKGYKLLKAFEDKNVFIFENSDKLNFSLSNTEYIKSNMLTF